MFSKMFEWLLGPMNNILFDGIVNYLLKEQKFINSKGKIFKNEVCGLMALHDIKHVKIQVIRNLIYFSHYENLFKYKRFKDLMSSMKRELTPIIKKMTNEQNLTKSEISSVCSDPTRKELKEKIQAMILSYLFMFLEKELEIGAGDIAASASNFPTGLSNRHSSYFESSNIMLTNMFNDLVNGSLPGSIFHMSNFFITPDKNAETSTSTSGRIYKEASNKIGNTLKMLFLTDISFESLRNYHYLWYTFNNKMKTFTLFCTHSKSNCSDPTKYTFAFEGSLKSLLIDVEFLIGKG